MAGSSAVGDDVWDTGVWDIAVWGGGKEKFQKTVGVSGIGRTVAIAMSGASTVDTTLVDMGLLWRSGGML